MSNLICAECGSEKGHFAGCLQYVEPVESKKEKKQVVEKTEKQEVKKEEKPLSIFQKLVEIQKNLKAPKGQFNKFGNYKYRSCEDILEAVKPLVSQQGLIITITDEIINIGERYYVKAIAKVFDEKSEITVSALAREEEQKKGMDGAQITGAASSYARKYALNGLFAIDDTKDADTKDNTKEEIKKITEKQVSTILDFKTALELSDEKWAEILSKMKIKSLENLTEDNAQKLIDSMAKKLEAKKLSNQ